MTNEKKPHFLKVPFKFRKHIDGTTPGTAFLLGPSGNTWCANLVQHNEDLFLQDGWAEFVRDHILECDDSFLFRYDGDLHFTVRVFDESSCEKEATFYSVCSQRPSDYGCHSTNKRERETPTLLDCIIEGTPKKVKSSPVHSEFMSTNQELQIVVYGRPQEEAGCLNDRSEEEVGCTLNNNVTVGVLSIGNSEAMLGGWNRREDLLLSAPEAERVAQSSTSSLPYFTKVMKRFNVSGSYTLTWERSNTNNWLISVCRIFHVSLQWHTFPKCKVKIVLHNLKGKSWSVNSVPTTKVQTLHTFCGGWLGFVGDNNINVGDFCIFELVTKCELRVCIIRVKRDCLGNCSGKEVHKAMFDKSRAKQKKTARRKAKKNNGNSHNAYLQQIKKVDKKGQDPNKVKCVKSSQSSSQDLDWAMTTETISPGSLSSRTKGCLSLKPTPEEKLAAELFLSHLPHFVKIMKKFNVSGSYTLAIPQKFVNNLREKLAGDAVLHGPSGCVWNVGITAYGNTLYFKNGWKEFVHDHFLEENDVLIFKYTGNSRFDVLMFDQKSLCEKESSYFIKRRSNENIKVVSNQETKGKSAETVEATDESSHEVFKCRTAKRLRMDDMGASTSVGRPPQSNVNKQGNNRRGQPFSVQETSAWGQKLLSRRRTVDAEEKLNTLNAAIAVASESEASFVMNMLRSHVHVGFYVSIPAEWANKHLPCRSQYQYVILQVEEKTWKVKFHMRGHSCGLAGGWKKFVVENYLQESDVCVFNLVTKAIDSITMKVQIFRVVENNINQDMTPASRVIVGGVSRQGQRKRRGITNSITDA